MKKTALNQLAVLLAITAFVLSGCMDRDKDYYVAPDYGAKDASQLSFSTTQDVQLKFNYNSPTGLISTFEIYAENPFQKETNGSWTLKNGLSPIAAGINVEGVSDILRTLPAYVKELYAYSPSLFTPVLKHAMITGNVASFEEFNLNSPIVEEAATRSLQSGSELVDFYLKEKTQITRSGSSGSYYYKPTIDKTETFPTTVQNAIAAAFPEKQKVDAVYYDDASIYIFQEDVKDEGAELWVSVISSQGTYNNSLAYFCFDGTKEELAKLTAAEKAKLKVICAFQYAKLNTATNGLHAGQYVKLKYYNKQTGKLEDKFPVGTTVGWVLSANGFYTSGSGSSRDYLTRGTSGSDGKPWYYSIPSWNPEKNNKNHTIIFTATDKGKDYICFGFEDMNNEGGGDGDCNDVMFHIIANPIKSVVPPPHIPEEGTVETKEYKKGILAFEDYWPRKFDYDLNDVVAKYESAITYVQKTEDKVPVGDVMVKSLTDKISMIHAGADLKNAFSYKVNIPVASVLKVTVDGNDYAPIVDGVGFIIDLCPDVNSVIEPYIIGTTPKVYNIVITLKEGALSQDNFNKDKQFAPYNPFIFSTEGKEIHLPNYTPTTRVDTSYFGTEDDMSSPGANRWYVSGTDNQYPFALHLSGVSTYDIPDEHKSIETTYPRYTNWVLNGCGNIDADWYIK